MTASDARHSPFPLGHWKSEDLERFLRIRQEFFLDPLGSNRDRFVEAAVLLQRALFDWYLSPPTHVERVLSLVSKEIGRWSALRKEEQRTLQERRFSLSTAAADVPAVESGVSTDQWQRIVGSLALGLKEPGTFDRFLVQLDDETNPSLRVNHRYMGELLPHDNMISYFSSMVATFLNENAIIGRVSPCVTHMEEAAARWLLTLVGWDGGFRIEDDTTAEKLDVPVQRLPTLCPPNRRFDGWQREEPLATIVAGGTVANLSALLIARNAVFDYLLGWDGAVQALGPSLAWDCIRKIWGYKRQVVLTSLTPHYSIAKAALNAGIPPENVVKLAGSANPWRLDKQALSNAFAVEGKLKAGDLVIAVVPIAGTTEHGYVDDIAGIAELLESLAEEENNVEDGASTSGAGFREREHSAKPTPDDSVRPASKQCRPFERIGALPSFNRVVSKLQSDMAATLEGLTAPAVKDAARVLVAFYNAKTSSEHVNHQLAEDLGKLTKRLQNGSEIDKAHHNRLFLHIDAAHGGGYLAVPFLRHGVFRHIELADTVTVDGHKSLYCYYPCGGLLIRTARWARTLTAGTSKYINEETDERAYPELKWFYERLEQTQKDKQPREADSGDLGDILPPWVTVNREDRDRLIALQRLIGRSSGSRHSELEHHPYERYLEGSRGTQGIMQIYFNLATLGFVGYRSILEWTYLLRERCEEAVSLGLSDLRPVTDPPLMMDAETTTCDVDARTPCPLTRKEVAIATAMSGAMPPMSYGSVRGTVPIAGGRLLLLSEGSCNQLLVSFVPAKEAKLIATASDKYWKEKDNLQKLLHLLWRVNEHLWHETYANPQFTYYVGHTHLDLRLPGSNGAAKDDRAERLARLLQKWNVWAQPPGDPNTIGPFFKALALKVGTFEEASEKVDEKRDLTWRKGAPSPGSAGPTTTTKDPGVAESDDGTKEGKSPAKESGKERPKFFCHKVILTHPFTDETLIGDMLRRLVFWGARSRDAVLVADQAWELLKPMVGQSSDSGGTPDMADRKNP